MTSEIMLKNLVASTDVLAIVAAATIYLCLSNTSQSKRWPAAMVGGLVLWGAAWTWVPMLSALRLGPAASGAPSAAPTLGLIAGTAIVLTLLALTSTAQAHLFSRIERRSILSLGSWRTVFGAGLLMIGLSGGLPAGFFWSAAVGDIVVGVTSTALLASAQPISNRTWLAWNTLGLADLLHVLVLAAAFVPAFFLANPKLPPLNLVPMLIVPTFIAFHAGALRRHAATRPTMP